MSRIQKAKRQRKPAVQPQLWDALAGQLLSPVTLGIAHDLNNQHTGILALSDLSLREIGLDSPVRRQLELIRGSGERAAELVRRLFQEHQAKLGSPELHDLNTLTRNAFELVRWAFHKSIETSLSPAPEPLPVRVDAIGFRTALLHVAARAAEQGGKTFEIRTFSQASERRKSTRAVRSPPPLNGERAGVRGGAVRLARSWAACAISAGISVQKQAADSLGLGFVKQFALNSGGTVTIEPNGKSGTIVTMRLPQLSLE